MQYTPMKKELLAALKPPLAAVAFNNVAGGEIFTRKNDHRMALFGLSVKQGLKGFDLYPFVSLRIERVEEIWHLTSNAAPDVQKSTHTMGSRVGEILYGDSAKCEIPLNEDSPVAVVLPAILTIFREFALPYFERWNSLAAVDAELNNQPTVRTPHCSLASTRCSRSIIVAKLVGRPNYDELVAIYSEVMGRIDRGSRLPRFQALLKSLERIAPGSGLKPE